MLAVQHKSGDMPAHDENAHGDAGDRGTYGIDITQVLRRQEKGIRTKGAHEITVDRTADDEPE